MNAQPPSPVEATEPEPCTNGARAARLLYGALGAAALGTVAYAFLIRPWHLRWGATDEESAADLPGDDLLHATRMQTTRGITIEASAADIWPWLVQMGQGRGGLYSYDWLENLVGCDIHSLDTISPEIQPLKVGEMFRLGPEGYPFFTVASIRPERELVLVAGPGRHDQLSPQPPMAGGEYVPEATWAFVLRPVEKNRTRLLVRLRGDWDENIAMTLFNRLLLEPAHFVMERKMMHGIKERAEKKNAS